MRKLLHKTVLYLSLASSAFGIRLFAEEGKNDTGAVEEKRQPKKNIRVLSFSDKKNAQEIRANAIKSIRELLQTTKRPAERFELLRRYGELYVEQGEYALEKELLLFERKHVLWSKTKKGPPPVVENKNSRLSLLKAIEIYKEIVQKYANYPGIDVTYYELGKSLLQIDNEEGLKYLSELIAKQPNSQYVPEAQFAIGEWYFDKHDMVKAKSFYQEAARHKEHIIYPYAVYKLGWAYYNYPSNSKSEEVKKFNFAVNAFKLVVQLSSRKDADDKAIFLRQEAINDLVMVWAETEDVDSAWTYFRKIGDEDAFYNMLERLGNIYIEQGKFAKAVTVYTRILKEKPNRESNHVNHRKLLDIYAEINAHKQVVNTLSLMTKTYLKEGSWYKANIKNTEVLAEAEKEVVSSFERYSATYHKKAQEKKEARFYAIAARLYQLFIATFPKHPNLYETRFLYADTLFELKKYDEAATQYFLVVKMNEKDGKYLKDSALNAVLAMNNVVDGKKYPKLPDPAKIKSPISIPKEKLKLRFALDQYVRLFEKDKEASAMEASAAKITYEYGHVKDGLDRLVKLALRRRGTIQSEESVRTVLKHHNDRRDWDQVIASCKLFLNTPEVLKDKLRESTLELHKFATFQRAIDFDKDKKFEKAALAFLDYQKEFPSDKKAPDAVYNAMVIYFREGDVAKAFDAAKLVLKSYPTFDKKDNIVATVSQSYEALGDFENAASFYALFAKQWPKDKRAPNALYSAAILYKGSDKLNEAVDALSQFISAYPRHELILPVHIELADVYEKLKMYPQSVQSNNVIVANFMKISASDAAYAQVKSALITHKYLDAQKGALMLSSVKNWLLQKNSPDALVARRLLSEHFFNMVDTPLKDFIKEKIEVSDLTKLEPALVAKQNKLLKLVKDYNEIVALGHPEYDVAATYRLGQAHEAFAILLSAIQLPASVAQETAKEVRGQLEALSGQLKGQAIAAYKLAYDRSIKYSIFTDWGALAYDRMTLLDPRTSPQIREFYVDPSYASHSIEYDKSVATVLH